MSNTNENIDLGFRDLLFNSGVACMLLFIIFSIRTGKDSIQIENVTDLSAKNFKFQDQYSLIVDETVETGNYKSLLAVEVEGVSQDQFAAFANSNFVRWSVPDNPDHFYTYSREYQLLTFYLVTGKLSSGSISLKFNRNDVFDHPYEVTAKIIDGKSAIELGSEGGLFQRTWDESITLREKEIIFRPASLEAGTLDPEFELFDMK